MVKSREHADADHARHVGIVDAGADHGAEPRAVEQQPEAERHDHGNDDDRQPVMREDQRAVADETSEAVRRGDANRVAAPDHQAKIGDDEGHAERHQHLRQRLAGQLAQQEAFDQGAEGGDQNDRQQHRHPEIERHAQIAADKGGAEICPEHEQRAMRQIGDAHQAKDQRKARRQQKQQAAEGDAVDRQQQPEGHLAVFPLCPISVRGRRRTGARGGLGADQHLVSGG